MTDSENMRAATSNGGAYAGNGAHGGALQRLRERADLTEEGGLIADALEEIVASQRAGHEAILAAIRALGTKVHLELSRVKASVDAVSEERRTDSRAAVEAAVRAEIAERQVTAMVERDAAERRAAAQDRESSPETPVAIRSRPPCATEPAGPPVQDKEGIDGS